jgi:hypothetical protein
MSFMQMDQELWFEEFLDQEIRELNQSKPAESEENILLDLPF